MPDSVVAVCIVRPLKSEIQQSYLKSNPSALQNFSFIFERQEPNILLLVVCLWSVSTYSEYN